MTSTQVAKFIKAVEGLSKKQPSKPLADAIGALAKRRLTKPTSPRQSAPRDPFRTSAPSTSSATPTTFGSSSRTTRRSRRGVYNYELGPVRNTARFGTWRHYLVAVIQRHTNSFDALAEHSKCDNPKFAKNKLDFKWAAKEGYIKLV